MEKIVVRILLLSVLCGLAASRCGYDSCNKEKPGMVNVHIVPHTHNDPGWLITVDQYYYRFVSWILNTVIPELEKDPSRRFIYVEISFFSRWWNDNMSKETKDRVRKLVNEGRLEFILGGWVMNDEAAAHYTAMIDQHKRGFEFLRETFGECARPKIGWQIDPFGHSREQASMFAQFGFDGFFFGRLDRQDKDLRKEQHRMEFIWQGSPKNLEGTSSIFTGVLPNNYDWPKGFNFDAKNIYNWKRTYDLINDNPNLADYNKDQKVKDFINITMEVREWFNTDHIIATMGSDFNYVDSYINFREMDKLIKYVNEQQSNGSKVNVLYSTPSCYLKALNEDKRTWTTKQDDFFPYANRNHTYWTGFFTSRPSQKYYTRYANAYGQAVKKLAAMAKIDNSKGSLDKLVDLENSRGLLQHHDSITGTEKQVVTYDYIQRLHRSLKASEETLNEAYSKIIEKSPQTPAPNQIVCSYSNVSICPVTQNNKEFEVTVFNAQATPREFGIRIPVNGDEYQVSDSDGKTVIPNDVFPRMPTVEGIHPIEMNPAMKEMTVEVAVPPMGFKTFFVRENKTDILRFRSEKKEKIPDESRFIEGNFYRVDFDENGYIQSITNKKEGITTNFTQNFFYYEAFQGNNRGDQNRSSGAYIFRPKSQTPIPVKLTKWMGIYKGQVVQEARQQFNRWITQAVRVYKNSGEIEMEWTVGPIPKYNQGKEVITRYNIPGFGNKGVFYTDSNGREMLERRLNYRPTWPVVIDEPVAGNYYPVTTVFYIKSGDGKRGFAVLPDRAEGGSSLNDGDVEMMLHRRLLYDDEYGVGEALDEPGLNKKGLIVRGTHRLVFGSTKFITEYYRVGAQNAFQQPLVTFSHSGRSPSEYVKQFKPKFSGLARRVPRQVNIVSFEQLPSGGPIPSPPNTTPYLVRFENFYEAGENVNMSKTVSFDIKDMFVNFSVASVRELSLGANAAVDDINRLVWNTKSGPTPGGLVRALKGTTVTLKPMQITTLQVNFKA